MSILNNSLFYNWVYLIESHFDMEPAKRRSLPFYEIVWEFKQHMENEGHPLEKRRDLAKKIKILSKEKIQYYHSSRFGFIKEFFSSLRNFLVIGSFKSSGQLGLEWSQDFLKQSKSVLGQLVNQSDEPIHPKKQIVKQEIEQTEQEEVLYEDYEESIVNVDFEKDELVNIQESRKEEQIIGVKEQPFIEVSEEQADIIDTHILSPKEEVISMKAPQSPKEKMIETLYNIWQHASEAERNQIKNMWILMMKPAQVVGWEPAGKPNEYQLELKEEILGSHPEVPMGQLVLKRKMKIAFSEEKIRETDNYRQIILFPDQGVCFRIGIGWFSKDNAIERIMIEENRQHEIWCTVEALGQSLAKSANDTITFWKKTQWNS